MTDIAVTGIGVISSIGAGRDIFWENCRKAQSGIKRINSFDTESFRSNIAAFVEGFDPASFMPPMSYRRMSRISRMAVAASIEALKDSGLNPDSMDRERIGVIVGTAYGSSSHVDEFYLSLLRDGPRGAQPFLFPEIVPNALASHIAIFHNITGPNNTFCQNDISAENAILYAWELLSRNIVDVVIVGGADEVSETLYSCYNALKALSNFRADNDEHVFPETNSGIVLGEGAGVMVMERLESALERNAKIYGTILSGTITGGTTPNGHYEASGSEIGRAVTGALEKAGIEPYEIDHINVSANFSSELDRIEYGQLKKIFMNHLDITGVTPLKYLIGNFGGAGIIRSAAILLSLYNQLPLPAVSAEILGSESHEKQKWDIPDLKNIRKALMTSTTFGGGSACLVFSKY